MDHQHLPLLVALLLQGTKRYELTGAQRLCLPRYFYSRPFPFTLHTGEYVVSSDHQDQAPPKHCVWTLYSKFYVSYILSDINRVDIFLRHPYAHWVLLIISVIYLLYCCLVLSSHSGKQFTILHIEFLCLVSIYSLLVVGC